MLTLLTALVACASTPATDSDARLTLDSTAPTADTWALTGGTVVGLGPADLTITQGRITAVGTADPALPAVDVSGHWLAPAFIDSHVHLVYDPRPTELARGGVAGVVDLAAPESVFDVDWAPLRAVKAGPMVTAVGGYPTTGWGSSGYGLECVDAEAAAAAVDHLVARGAGVIKLPVTGGAQLDDPALAAAVERARTHGVPVASHALGDSEATRAHGAGADVLAHTPTGALSAATVSLWSDRAVISTLRAFGSGTAVANLGALHQAGATVLYGTDFGNSRTARIDPGELQLLVDAGLTPAEVLAAGTSVAAGYWGFEELGSLAVGKAASVLVLAADPLSDLSTLGDPVAVYLDGVRLD